MLDGVSPVDPATSLLGVIGTSVLSPSSLVWILPDWDVNWIPDSTVENGVDFGKVPLIHGWPRPSPLISSRVGFDQWHWCLHGSVQRRDFLTASLSRGDRVPSPWIR